MAEEHKTNVAKMKMRHAASVSVMMASLAVSAKTYQVMESDMNATLASSKDEQQAHDAALQARSLDDPADPASESHLATSPPM